VVVELRQVEEATGERLDAYIGVRRVALVRAKSVDNALQTVVLPDPRTEYGIDDMVQLLEALTTLARTQGAGKIYLSSQSVLVRELARRFGFEGNLRDPLVRSLVGTEDQLGVAAHDDDDLPCALERFGVLATARSSRNPLSRIGRRLSSGIASSIEMTVEWSPGRSFLLAVPDRSDLMNEAVARCADTAGAILRRFSTPAPLVREIRFDRSDRGLIEGTQGGHATGHLNTIHLNVAYCAANAMLELRQKLGRTSVDSAPRGGGLSYTAIDALTAHEIWHLIEGSFEVQRYSESIEFRRALGEALGVPTLEHAIKGNHPRAPEPLKNARTRLAEEVSPYGATKTCEATAEMFKVWWCRTGDVTPIVARFGELIGDFFPGGVD
jgi:hypothetical protein